MKNETKKYFFRCLGNKVSHMHPSKKIHSICNKDSFLYLFGSDFVIINGNGISLFMVILNTRKEINVHLAVSVQKYASYMF